MYYNKCMRRARPIRFSLIALAVAALIHLVLFSVPLFAQTVGTTESLSSLELTPANPAPGSTFRAEVRNFTIDLERAFFSWEINGSPIREGVGLKEITIPVGKLGEVLNIRVSIAAQSGETLTLSRSVRPSIVDVVWQANTYTPPFYRGRALPSHGSTVSLEAIAHFERENGTKVPWEDIIYTWKINGRVIGESSGRGRSTLTTFGPGLFGEMAVKVEAESADFAFRGSGTTVIANTEPVLALYPLYPVGGVALHSALTRVADVSDIELSVSAQPYYAASLFPASPLLSYEWSVNGEKVANDDAEQNVITLRSTAGAGVARVSLSFEHAAILLQEAENEWTLNFGSSVFESGRFNPFGRTTETQ